MAETRERSAWGQEQRLEFIDFRLYWERRINRVDLMDHFGVSTAQASLDLRQYQRLAPSNLRYDTRSKIYLAADEFKPLFVQQAAESYLGELLALRTGAIHKRSAFIGWAPSADIIRAPFRRVVPSILGTILRATRELMTAEVEYAAYEHAGTSRLIITPHALFFDGFRWHVRAHCAADGTFDNFVLGRFTAARLHSKSDVDARTDKDWNTFVEVVIAPHPELEPAARRAVELDFGMVEGAAAFTVRRALLVLTLSYLGIVDAAGRASTSHGLILLNRPHIEALLQGSKAV